MQSQYSLDALNEETESVSPSMLKRPAQLATTTLRRSSVIVSYRSMVVSQLKQEICDLLAASRVV